MSHKDKKHHSHPEHKEEENEAISSPFAADEQIVVESSEKPKLVQITDEELRQMQKDLHEYKDKYLRQLAETENARKRMQKEKQEITRYAIESFIIDCLRPLDNLENALRFAQEMSDEVKNWAIGFQMILTQFKDILANNGVSSFDSVGKPFNPHDHEAIEMVESDTVAPGIVMEEHVRGYKMGERTIRAARVKVAKAETQPIPTKE